MDIKGVYQLIVWYTIIHTWLYKHDVITCLFIYMPCMKIKSDCLVIYSKYMHNTYNILLNTLYEALVDLINFIIS